MEGQDLSLSTDLWPLLFQQETRNLAVERQGRLAWWHAISDLVPASATGMEAEEHSRGYLLYDLPRNAQILPRDLGFSDLLSQGTGSSHPWGKVLHPQTAHVLGLLHLLTQNGVRLQPN